MSTIQYKGLCQVEVKLKKGYVIVHARSTAKVVFGASFNNCNNVRAARTASELCADND